MHPSPGRFDTSLERRYLAFLAEVGTILGEPLPYEATVQRICDAAVETVADVSTMYLFDAAGELQFVGGAHTIAERSERLRRRALALMRDPKGPRWWFESLVRKGRSLLIPQVDEATIGFAGGSRQFVDFIQEIGVRSFLIVPVFAQGEVTGAFALVYADSGLHYDNESLALAEDLGRRVGAALGQAKLHDTAMRVSATFQLAALPKALPAIGGCRMDSLYEPGAIEMLVGGDWFDAFELSGQRVGISVGDVSGHGVEAAAYMGIVRSGLHIAMLLEHDPIKVLSAADVLLRQESRESMYATASIAILDTRTRTLTCASAGHPGPLRWSERTQTVSEPFVDRGLALGARNLADSPAAARTIDVDSGDFFVFFTDGLLEGKRDYEAGMARLTQAIANRWIREAEHPARAIRDAVAPERHEDDVAILTLRFGA